MAFISPFDIQKRNLNENQPLVSMNVNIGREVIVVIFEKLTNFQ